MDQGESPTDIVRILGVRRNSLYRWHTQARSGPDGLAGKPHPGPTPRLSDEQLVHLEDLLLDGATAHLRGSPPRGREKEPALNVHYEVTIRK